MRFFGQFSISAVKRESLGCGMIVVGLESDHLIGKQAL